MHPLTGLIHWREPMSWTARNPPLSLLKTSHPQEHNQSTVMMDFWEGTYVRLSPPPPTSHDSPGLPTYPYAYCAYHYQTPHVSFMYCLMTSLMYACFFSPPLIHMYAAWLCP